MDSNHFEISLSDKYKSQLKDIKSNLISGDRRLAVILLDKIIPHIDTDLFLEHVLFLLQNLVKNLETSNDQDDQILCIRALNQILIKIYDVNIPNFTRELGLTIIPNMIKRLMQFRSYEVVYAANCLSILATLFPTLIAANRQAIEKRIFQLVDSIQQSENDNHELLKLLGFCYCKIYLSGPTALMTRWREIISKLINSFLTFAKHPVFSHIMKPIKMFYFNDSGPLEMFISDNKSDYSLSMTKKLYFISAVLCSAITGQFQMKLPLPIEAIIECLNLMMIISTTKSPTNAQQKKEPNIHTSSIILQNVFIILRALIITCQSNILCYSRLIIHIVNVTIEWMKQQPLAISTQSHLFSELRCSVLKFLTDYFETLRLNTCLSNTEFEIILNFILEKIPIIESVPFDDDSSNTIYSIRCLNSLINNSSNIVDKSSWRKIQNLVIPTLFQIYRKWFCLNNSYKKNICRQELLETVRLILINLDVENDVPLEAIISVMEEANRLENSSKIRQLITSTIHLTNYVLLSRIPIKNEMLELNSTETDENSIIFDHHLENDQKRKAIDDDEKELDMELIPSSSKQLKTLIEIVNDDGITMEESNNDKQQQNMNNSQMEIDMNDEKSKSFEIVDSSSNDDDEEVVIPSSSQQLMSITNNINESSNNQQQQQSNEQITITIEDSSDDDHEQIMVDKKKSNETKNIEDDDEISLTLKLLVD
uniref:Uncharacterized protein LOC113798367 n=1 Tax=Dermatophagoides pteronyssinus TaxID=6956 RepID=A0A6P6YII7_DERPT|nr:uncharacterized protein LOC113798367 [Dermatophagoides pteronyssinus]